jgi:HK97 family phage major capsid protein
MEMKEMLDQVKTLINEQATLYKSALEEQKIFGKASAEKIEKLEKMAADSEKWTNAYNDLVKVTSAAEESKKRIDELETRLNRKGANGSTEEYKFTSLGEHATESKEFKDFIASRGYENRKGSTGTIRIPDPWSFGVKDIVTESQGTSLIRSERRAGILQIPNVPLTIRSIMAVGRTGSNSIEYVKEQAHTNNAGPQYSPNSSPAKYDGALKNKSEITYTLATSPVRTVAHYMKASRQILDDVPQLQSEINNRLLYFLALEEEREILLGDGTAGELLGIIPQSTAYDTAYNVSGDSKIDTIRHAILQVTVSKYMATNVVLHPEDWHDIELVKTGEGASANTGAYLMSNPASGAPSRLWGLPVLQSLQMTAGDFLVGNFPLGAQIFDRMEASVQIANQNEDDFIRNLITILAEERIALAVYRSDAFVEGDFPQ